MPAALSLKSETQGLPFLRLQGLGFPKPLINPRPETGSFEDPFKGSFKRSFMGSSNGFCKVAGSESSLTLPRLLGGAFIILVAELGFGLGV